MRGANFTDYFTNNPERFKDLVKALTDNGYVTDEGFGVSRCILDMNPTAFDEMFELQYPEQENPFDVMPIAFPRRPGEYVYVLFDLNTYGSIKRMEAKIRYDGILDLEDEDDESDQPS